MVRLPRLVLPGLPYHVTQRGNRREQTFFEDGDYELYRSLLSDAAASAGSEMVAHEGNHGIDLRNRYPTSETRAYATGRAVARSMGATPFRELPEENGN